MLAVCEGATGRGRNTAWWADREKWVGGMVASQILPFAGELAQLRN